MALSRQQKEDSVAKVRELLDSSKMTVFVRYSGSTVKDMQLLRSQARESGTQIMVIKNRLFKQALHSTEKLSNVGTDSLSGQLLYAFNEGDEAAPAQNLAVFAKNNPQIEFVGGISGDGQLLSAEEVKQLAALPSKDQLKAQFITVVQAPVSSLVGVMAANVRSVMNVLNARAESI